MSPSSPEVPLLLEQARRASADGRRAEARNLFETILAVDPEQAEALHGLGSLLVASPEPELGLSMMLKAVQKRPGDLSAQVALADAYAFLEKHEHALATYRRALALAPTDTPLLVRFGRALAAAGDLDESTAVLARALAVDPASTDAQLALGMTRLAQGEIEEAARLFSPLLAGAAAPREALYGMGRVCQARGDDELALVHLASALEQAPNDPEVRDAYAESLTAVGRHADAAAQYAEAIRRVPTYVRSYLGLADSFERSGRRPEAVSLLEAALTREDHDWRVLNRIAQRMNRLGAYEAALGCVDRALALNGDSEAAFLERAVALAGVGQLDEAIHSCRRAVTLHPEAASPRAQLGALLYERGDLDAAAKQCELALALEPNHRAARDQLARVELGRGRLRHAWPHWWQRSSRDPRAWSPAASEDDSWDWAALTVELLPEATIADTLLMLRFLPLLRERVGSVEMQLPSALVSLAASQDQSIPPPVGRPAPSLKLHLGDLPALFQADLDGLPGRDGYLRASGAALDGLRTRLGESEGRPIVVLQGAHPRTERARAALDEQVFGALCTTVAARYVSLEPPARVRVRRERAAASIEPVSVGTDLDESAALLTAADLIITTDPLYAHLAGALGRPAWLVVSQPAHWVWMSDRHDCPWYRSVRLYRTQRPAQGPDLASRLVSDLRTFLSSRRETAAA